MPTDFGEHGNSFVDRFFEVDRKAPSFFFNAFTQPLKFPQLVKILRPEEGLKKVVLVDGHPRTGKTWMSVAAAATVIREEHLGTDQWWTSGVDSLSISDSRDNLANACQKVLAQLNQSLKIVLLNDLLGTNYLRDFGPAPSRPALRRFLQWDEKNPWLRALSEGSTLVLVERAMFFTLAENLLAVDIRGLSGEAPQVPGIKVARWRHGLFRSREDGSAIGAFDEQVLSELKQRNFAHHPFRLEESEDRKRLFSNAPLVAFSDWKKLSIDEKDVASWSAFGGDLKSIARVIEKLESRTGSARTNLDELYLILLAPALVFLGPYAYEALGIDPNKADSLRNDLFLEFDAEGEDCRIASGRIPNELYVWTLREHIQERLPLLVKVCQRVISKLPPGKEKNESTVGLLLRGIIEQALISENRVSKLAQIRAGRTWKSLVKYLKGPKDYLLSVEGAFEEGEDSKEQALTPGTAAAVGWAAYYFFCDNDELRRRVRDWFQNGLHSLLHRWSDTSREEDRARLWDEVTGSFSSLLQWAVRGWREKKGNPRELAEVEEIFRSLINSEALNKGRSDEAAKDFLRMILEDELAWGRIFDAGEPNQREWRDAEVQELFRESFQFFEERPERTGASAGPARVVDRVFSLAWHNEWKPIADGRAPGDKNFAKPAKGYFDAFKEAAFELVQQNPALLDRNLQYHWVHFVTQHAIWMRQWCFQADPDEWERRRGAPGSSYPEDNDDLVEIFGIALKTNPDRRRVRNCLLLVGMRVERLRHSDSLTNAVDHLLKQDGEQSKDTEIGLLQAMFELMRQGYYDRLYNKREVGVSGIHWNVWCSKKFSLLEHRVEEAWAEHWQELSRLSHKFDLLPPRQRGWEELIPWHWRQVKGRAN